MMQFFETQCSIFGEAFRTQRICPPRIPDNGKDETRSELALTLQTSFCNEYKRYHGIRRHNDMLWLSEFVTILLQEKIADDGLSPYLISALNPHPYIVNKYTE